LARHLAILAGANVVRQRLMWEDEKTNGLPDDGADGKCYHNK
jgi:hypothetical protein